MSPGIRSPVAASLGMLSVYFRIRVRLRSETRKGVIPISESENQGENQEFWFNSQTNEVEVGKQSLAIYRIGPFRTANEAKAAYEIIRLRNKSWDDDDEEWSKAAKD